MSQKQDTIVTALMEQLIAEGPDGMAQVFTALFNLALRLERERFLGAGLYERNAERRGYANGYKSKTVDTTAGTVTVDVPKAAGTDEPFYPQSLEAGQPSRGDSSYWSISASTPSSRRRSASSSTRSSCGSLSWL